MNKGERERDVGQEIGSRKLRRICDVPVIWSSKGSYFCLEFPTGDRVKRLNTSVDAIMPLSHYPPFLL